MRGRRRGPVGILAVTLLLGIGGGCAASLWPGPVTDHFDGWRFHQPEPLTIGFFDWLKRAFSGNRRGRWRAYTDTPPGPLPPMRVAGGDLRVTLVNHATVLVQMDGLNI